MRGREERNGREVDKSPRRNREKSPIKGGKRRQSVQRVLGRVRKKRKQHLKGSRRRGKQGKIRNSERCKTEVVFILRRKNKGGGV